MNIFEWIKKLFFGEPPVEYQNDWHNSALPAPLDYRDVSFGAIKELTPTPETYHIPYVLRIHDQGHKPTCGGETGAEMKEEKERRERNFVDFDGDWLYGKAKEIDGVPLIQGTHFRAVLSVLKNKGCKPIGGTETDSANFKIGGYASVNPTFNELKTAIYQNGAICARFVGSNRGWSLGRIVPPKVGEPIWGHFVSLIGFDKDFIYFQNHWGDDWGEKGIGCFDEKYLPTEAWAILTDLPTNWKELMPSETTKPKYTFNNNLSYDQENDEVKTLQDCLKWLGCLDKNQASTGYFGLLTHRAVILFQQRYGINAIGVVGPQTRAKLNELFS